MGLEESTPKIAVFGDALLTLHTFFVTEKQIHLKTSILQYTEKMVVF